MDTFQTKLKDQLKSGEMNYKDAPIYTILYDLVDGNGIDSVIITLSSLCHDLDKKDELLSEIEKVKDYSWD